MSQVDGFILNGDILKLTVFFLFFNYFLIKRNIFIYVNITRALYSTYV